MKLANKFWLSSSILALISPTALISAEGWVPRNVDDVLEDIQVDQNNQKTYTVQSGDTLSVIAEAMGVSVRHLANINGIDNIDLIFPGNVITAQLNSQQQAVSLTIDTPQGESVAVDLPVNISPSTETASVEMTEAIEETQASVTTVETTTQEVVEPTSQAPVITEEQTEVVATTPVEVTEEEGISEVEAAETSYVSEAEQTTLLQTQLESVTEAVTTPAPVEATTVAPETEATTVAPVIETTVAPETEATTAAPVVETTVTEIPQEISEEISSEEVIESEDVVNENAEVAEEIVNEADSSGFDPMANPANKGLQPHVAAYKEEVAQKYGVENFSLYRPGDSGDHGIGYAVDFMVPVGSQQGDNIANYSISQMESGAQDISYIIWKQQIYGNWNHQWETMEDRGGVTANHYDHVHVSFNSPRNQW